MSVSKGAGRAARGRLNASTTDGRGDPHLPQEDHYLRSWRSSTRGPTAVLRWGLSHVTSPTASRGQVLSTGLTMSGPGLPEVWRGTVHYMSAESYRITNAIIRRSRVAGQQTAVVPGEGLATTGYGV